MQDRRAPEDKEVVRRRVERWRARRLEAELERERLVDWEFATGEDLPALTDRQLLALWAWRREHKIKGEFGWIEPWHYLLVTGRHRHQVDRAGECWVTRVDEQNGGRWGSEWERQATLSTLTKAWGRCLRMVKFKDGERRLAPAARAAGLAYAVLVTSALDLLYRGALVWGYQRWRWHLRGDWTARYWGTPALAQWNDKVNRAFLKLPIPGTVDDLFQFAHVRWWYPHYRLPPVSYRAPIAYVLDPEMGDWKHRPDPELSGVSRLLKATPYFDQILRTLNRQVEKECADTIEDEHNVDGRKLDRPNYYDPNSKAVALEFFSDGSLAVHHECEKRNRARMRGSIPLTSATSANSGIIGYVQLSPGWAARPPIPNADVALAVLAIW